MKDIKDIGDLQDIGDHEDIQDIDDLRDSLAQQIVRYTDHMLTTSSSYSRAPAMAAASSFSS